MGIGILGRGSNLGLNLGSLPANLGGSPHQISLLMLNGAGAYQLRCGQQHPHFGERSHGRFGRQRRLGGLHFEVC